ncbi:MAG: sulfatase-like hydrolase/transferase, partial [Proteobacteria bacterium]|nr:sulfatase-like hydrolase/transferase [Pseudomonadota bacterium]
YAHEILKQDVAFTLCWCGLLALIARWRMLGFASWPIAWLAYLLWLFLVLGEGVSYSLQADTFNARFFAHLNPVNLTAGLMAFPAMIGGGMVLLVIMAALCAFLMRHLAHRQGGGRGRSVAIRIVTIAALLLLVLGLNSPLRRLGVYVRDAERSAQFADTPEGRAVARQLDLFPTTRKRLIAAPGKNLVLIYMESLERQFWDRRVYPGLSPNLDRLRAQGLDFSGFQTFSGAGYTMAGVFASQCGIPLYTSAFAGIDEAAGNATDAGTFEPKLVCLGDVLRRAGYRQIFLGGAPISFSNKGLFFSIHGYNQAWGLDELEGEAGGKLPRAGWGLYDSTLFELALQRYRKLEATGKPFNLSLLTLDTHPPHGRPSPGCPAYAQDPNRVLQAVHCTDFLVGRFIDALAKEPDWNRTVVVIMSDHLAMRNDAEPLYPEHYHRQPALLVLNAGQGVRPVRMYHMDIAPTVLNLLGVRSNASFIAGADRSAPDAQASILQDNAVTESVLRKASWSHAGRLELCRDGQLLGWTAGGDFDLGGRELSMTYLGVPSAGIRDGQTLDFFMDKENAKLIIADDKDQPALLASRGAVSVLTIGLLPRNEGAGKLFTIDLLGTHGAVAHIAKIGQLRGLTIAAPDCQVLLDQVDAAPAGTRMDLADRFHTTTAPYADLPPAPAVATLAGPQALNYQRGSGWLWPQGWGSMAWGSQATLGFKLPAAQCHGATMRMTVDPYLPASRPVLDTQVWANGKSIATWHFRRDAAAGAQAGAGDAHVFMQVTAPLTGDTRCDAAIELRFERPGSVSAVIPEGEDPRDLQILVRDLGIDRALP